MKDISDIKMVGMDELRVPMIRKEPYIELFFKLNHQASKGWCKDFNDLVASSSFPIKIKPDEGLYIETWVRKPEEIKAVFDLLKTSISDCIEQYIEKIRIQNQSDGNQSGAEEASGEQLRLNEVIAGLDFDAE